MFSRSLLHRLLLIGPALCFGTASGQTAEIFFRNDYTYLQQTESFYKVHSVPRTWTDAKQRCALEGTTLFYPEGSNEVDAVLSYMNSTQLLSPLVFVGISSRLAKGVYMTVDGVAVRDIYNRWSPGEPNDINGEEDCVILRRDGLYGDQKCDSKKPFLCKKSKYHLKWNRECNVPYMDYIYNEEMGTCYKFHLNPLNWRDAAEACEAEQTYLAIANSLGEANYFANITAMARKDNIPGSYLRGAIHLGFHYDERYRDWITIKGQTLHQAGYASWAYNQPDGGEKERCGSMFYGGELNDISCEQHKCFFICERENESLNKISNGAD